MTIPSEKPTGFAESEVESSALDWLRETGYETLYGLAIAPGADQAERSSYSDVILLERLRQAVNVINPGISREGRESAIRQVEHPQYQALLTENRHFHDWLVHGVPVESKRPDGTTEGRRVFLIDFEHPEKNDWLAVNQYTVEETHIKRRADVVVFVNGLPLAVMELKNPIDERATMGTAFNQLQTYKDQIPSLLRFNEALIISDGTEAHIGSLSADQDRFMPWRTIEGEKLAPNAMPELEVLIKGAFDHRRFLDLLQYYIVFQDDDGAVIKIMAAYHQYHATQTALLRTLEASSPNGKKRCGVVWHTQGSGKSLTMAFYTGRVMRSLEMADPTIVVITDRNDLDEQLFTTFSKCKDLFKDTPVQAEGRDDLREKLNVASGGIVFTTVQKFMPATTGVATAKLSDRRNIVVIADEAHRSQYDFVDGYARVMRESLPNASWIGFTGTPIEHSDKDTYAVFGDCISIYDIQQSVDDHATVKIYYESRLAKLDINRGEQPLIDQEFDEATENEELEKKEKLKSRWAATEAIVGAQKRIDNVARDIVKHWDDRCSAITGKAMIVCMSRRICVDLYDALVRLRPEWGSKDPKFADGALRIVMTGAASDNRSWQKHIRTKAVRKKLAKEFRDASSAFRIVIVRDMWLTGFDVPCLNTMYLDKRMQGHGLMQAIARVNRIFKDKPGGLIVDYFGLAEELQVAVATYTQNGGQGNATVNQEVAILEMMKYYDVCLGIFNGFDWSKWTSNNHTERTTLLKEAANHALSLTDGKKRINDAVTCLSRAFALAVTSDEAKKIVDDVAFFQSVRAVLAKGIGPGQKTPEQLDLAVKQIVSSAISSDGIVDIFGDKGLNKPDVSVLSDEFLDEMRDMPQKHLAIETLQRLLDNEIHGIIRKNLVQERSFAAMLEKTVNDYQSRRVDTAFVLNELIEMGKTLRENRKRPEQLGLSDDEVAFYDALGANEASVRELGDVTLKAIAKDLVKTLKNSTTVDWTVRETVKAALRVKVKNLLRRYHYPPDRQEAATTTVLQQAEILCAEWAGEPE